MPSPSLSTSTLRTSVSTQSLSPSRRPKSGIRDYKGKTDRLGRTLMAFKEAIINLANATEDLSGAVGDVWGGRQLGELRN
ncbi:hypothetical protein HDU97_009916, partial [Phlyctochytrium planicorne]